MRVSVNREQLLRAAELAALGAGANAAVEQGTCVIFKDGRAFTFNGEVGVSVPAPDLGFSGAIPCEQLVQIAQKFSEPVLTVDATPGQIMFYGAGKKRAALTLEDEIRLPIETIDAPTQWYALNPLFAEAVGMVEKCTSTDQNAFVLSCIHVRPDGLESCDNWQTIRYPLTTGFTSHTLCRKDSLRRVIGLGVVEFGESEKWLHFRTSEDMIISLRRYQDTFPDLGPFLSAEGCIPATLPPGLAEVADKCAIFAAGKEDTVGVAITPGEMNIKRSTAAGFYEEVKAINYNGPPLRFKISAKLLAEVGGRSVDVLICPRKIIITTAKFCYAACLEVEG